MTSWQQLKLNTDGHTAERVSAWLEDRGALAVTLSDAGDTPVLEPDPQQEILTLWPSSQVCALFERSTDLAPLIDALAQQFIVDVLDPEVLADENWLLRCRDQFKPMQFGQRLWVHPSWHEPPDDQAICLQLDPGIAFGTGAHATTHLCLTWLESADLTGKTVLDYGCGSGILALAALKLGAAKVWAVDHCEQAVSATQANVQANGYSAAECQAHLPATLPPIQADVIVANILLHPLQTLAKQFASLQAPGADLVMSGVLTSQRTALESAYQAFYNTRQVLAREGWIAFHAQRQ